VAGLYLEYDGQVVTVTGWLKDGPAMFSIPRGGSVELFRCTDGSAALVCRDRHGVSKPMRVEEAQSA
jgi:hypothetical protein